MDKGTVAVFGMKDAITRRPQVMLIILPLGQFKILAYYTIVVFFHFPHV